jgi:hypothetical protein
LLRLILLAAIFLAAAVFTPKPANAAGYKAFAGEKTTWHNAFDRYDFSMDDATGAITPMTAPAKEVTGNSIDVALRNGRRRCVVVVPKEPAPGYPWSWRGCYWDHQPQAELELLRRGFHICFVAPDALGQGKAWDTWYQFLTGEHGLSTKPVFIGMSKGGINEYSWTVVNPDKVSCIYADNPAIYDEDLARLEVLARNDVPLLNICGTLDLNYNSGKHTLAIENRYHEYGGRITLMVKEGAAHHPHSLQNPKPIVDWMIKNLKPSKAAPPEFVDSTFVKSYYYSLENSYVYLPEEQLYATCRGPEYTPCYERYDVIDKRYDVNGHSGLGLKGMGVVAPNAAASGKPWVFRAVPIERDSTVDQALLAKGFHIVFPPIGGSGPAAGDWDKTYQVMVNHGFSKKPVMEGAGAAGGEAYAWAILNPDKVSCIFAENPVMRALTMSKTPLSDSLAPLARAGVPLIHDCGSLDPLLKDQTRVVEQKYKELGGQITVIIKEGAGHFPLQPKDPKPIVDLIMTSQK